MDDDRTYNLAFFLGPGLPLTFGGASGPSTAAVLLPPFFLTMSAGGGINDGLGVPTVAGVLGVDSDGLSPLELVATGGADVVVMGADSFDGVSSSLVGVATGSNFLNDSGDNLRMTTLLLVGFEDDFRRLGGTAAAFEVEAIVILMGMERDDGMCRSQRADRWVL